MASQSIKYPVDDLAGSPDVWARAQDSVALLTRRQRDVLLLLARGGATKEIAREMGLSPRTVEIHRAAILEKLDLRSSADAVRTAVYAAMAERFGNA